MRNVLISHAAGPEFNEMLDIAEPTFKGYAAKHDMDCVIERDIDCGRPASWVKILLFREMFQRGYQNVLWVDADAMIVNPAKNILTATYCQRPILWMVKHKVAAEGFGEIPNCGVMIVQVSPIMWDFLNQVWDQTEWINHPWWEQAAVLTLLGWKVDPPGGFARKGPDTDHTPRTGWLDKKWNSMHHDPQDDPYIKHWSGLPIAERLEGMRHEAESLISA